MRPPLRTLLGDHPATQAVRRGVVASPVVPLEFADVPVPNRAFKRVVRDLEFDVAELALMTFLMARSRGVPLRLLPVVVFSRNPLPHLVRRTIDRLMPEGLAGSRVGVRAYTTTTAVWIRAMLADEYGVPRTKCNGSRSRTDMSPACRIRPGRNARCLPAISWPCCATVS